MKPVVTINTFGDIKVSHKASDFAKMNIDELNEVIRNLQCVGIEAVVECGDESGNKYAVIHTYRMSIKDAERYIHVDEMNILYKKNLLHIDEDGSIMVVDKFVRRIDYWFKRSLDDALDKIEALKIEALIRRDEKMSKRRIGSHFISMCAESYDCGHRSPKHINASNIFDDVFKIIENM